jgi:hypothetical protein
MAGPCSGVLDASVCSSQVMAMRTDSHKRVRRRAVQAQACKLPIKGSSGLARWVVSGNDMPWRTCAPSGLAETTDDMMVTYTLRLSDDYIIEAYSRHRSRRNTGWLHWPIKALCAAGLFALLALGIFARIYAIAIIAAFFLALLAAGPQFDYWVTRRRWRRHPQFNEEVRVDISEDCVSFTSEKSSGTSQWSAYTSGLQHPTGVMLYAAAWDYRWFPDAAITSGTREQAHRIFRSQLRQYSVA